LEDFTEIWILLFALMRDHASFPFQAGFM